MTTGEPGPLLVPLDRHNQALLNLVHPLGRANPIPSGRYNLVVIGAGTAGLVAAAGAAGLGAKVALIEKGLLGGDCLNVGCVPSKALIRAARAIHDAKRVEEFGATLGGAVEPDFSRAMERMRRLRVAIAPNDSVARLTALGVDVFLGEGRFLSERAIEVQGARLEFARAVVASGARARLPNVPGLAEAEPLTNENVFSLTERPARLVVVGAGPIGCELAQAFRRLGSEVTLLGDGSSVLPKEDPEAAGIVSRALETDGVQLYLEAKLRSVERRGGERVLVFDQRGTRQTVAADQVLVAVGRAPNGESLGLGRAGIEFDPAKGVLVDDHLRTTNSRVYAAGDICSPYKFTHAADAMARIVIANALFHRRQRVSALTIPWVTYTDPEIARVGLNEAEARARGIAVDVLTHSLLEIDRAVLDGDTEGFARVLVARGQGRILGATLVARHAGEMMGEVVLAMTRGIGLGALSSTIHAYPTQASVWQRLGDQHRRAALSPGMKALFARWFTWTR